MPIGTLQIALLVAAGVSGTASVLTLIEHDLFSTGTDNADIIFQNDGDMAFAGATPSPAFGADEWLTPKGSGNGAAFEIRATLTAGSTPTTNAGLNVWLNLGTTRTWGNFLSGLGSITSTLTYEIGKAGENTAIVTTTDNLLHVLHV